MAIMDYRLEFCDATAVSGTVASGATAIGNVIDMGANNKDWGAGTPVWLHLRMKTAATAASNIATLKFVLENASTNTPASFSTALTLKDTTAYTTYVAGYKVYSGVLPATTLKRYLRIKKTVATTPVTAGQVDSWLDLSAI